MRGHPIFVMTWSWRRSHPDRLWITYTPNDDSCEGEYIFVGMSTRDGGLWNVGRCDANIDGGHPLLWDVTGSAEMVVNEVIGYLRESRTQIA